MFTDRQIKALKPRSTPYRVYEKGAVPGFCLQVTPRGVKTWNFAYRVAGQRRFIGLGRYPAITLSEARERAEAARLDFDRGETPMVTADGAQRRPGTVQDAVELYADDLRSRDKTSVTEFERSMAADVIPVIGGMLARDVRPAHVQAVLARVIARGVAVEHNKVRARLHAALNFALHYDHDPRSKIRGVRFGMTSNPVTAVPKDAAASARTLERNLSFDEIRALWHFDGWHDAPRDALLLMLALGGLRPNEVLGMRWLEIDWPARTLTIPPERFKGRRYHVVPLGTVAMALLDERYSRAHTGSRWHTSGISDLVFPAGDSYYSVKALGQYLRRQRAVGNWPAGVEPFTPYDLRRTWKTRTGELGIDKSIRDRIQGHALSDVSSRHYDRWDYLPEKKAAMALWDEKLIEVIN